MGAKYKTIENFRKFFKISVVAFDIQHTVSKALGYTGEKSYIHNLHIIAKEEIEKEKPSMEKVDYLLSLIQNEAKNNLIQEN